MRVAVFADIHGNSIALNAVLADITARGGADAYWVLGDLIAIGADPVGTLERLAALPNATFVQGNTERYLLTGERPYPSIQDALAAGAAAAPGGGRALLRLDPGRNHVHRLARLARRGSGRRAHKPA